MDTTSAPVGGHSSARIIRRDFLTLTPAECAVCNRATHEEGFADPQVFIEWHGSIVFCYDCTAEMARLFGMITPRQWQQYTQLVAEQEKELNTLRDSVAKLESQVDSLTYERLVSRGLLNLPAHADSDIANSETNDEAVSAESSDADELADETSKLLAGISSAEGYDISDGADEEPDAPEPIVSKRPANVRKSASKQSSVADLGL